MTLWLIMDESSVLNAPTYTAPNGASMRPNSPLQHIHIRRHTDDGDDMVIYAIPKGTSLSDDLILVHERSDHYSLQPAEDMTLEDLNEKMTEFMKAHGKKYTKTAWIKSISNSHRVVEKIDVAVEGRGPG